jgi:hypothetical protein
MKNVLLSLTTLAALTLSVTAGAECIYPKATAEIPNGSTAKQEEIVTAMNAVKKYNSDINAYISCLEMESESQIAAITDPKPSRSSRSRASRRRSTTPLSMSWKSTPRASMRSSRPTRPRTPADPSAKGTDLFPRSVPDVRK